MRSDVFLISAVFLEKNHLLSAGELVFDSFDLDQ